MKQLENGMKEDNSPEMKKETTKTKERRHGILKNETCRELLFGNFCYYILGQIVIFLFVYNTAKLEVSLGFLLGVLTSVGMLLHMTISLEQAMYMGEKGALNHVRKTTGMRFSVVIIIFVVVGITNICNILAALIGVMALKVSAYLQPFTHKVLAKKFTGKGR